MTPHKLAKSLQGQFRNAISGPIQFRGEVTLELGDAARIAEVCSYAKASLGFNYLTDITSVDHLEDENVPRFSVVYELYGLEHQCHLRLKTRISEENPELPTVTTVWRTANWHEREIYDMMGIRFAGHPDLRRILMWDGYPYHPLRKDFPLAGKESDMPDVAFTNAAPLEGGPFVTNSGKDTEAREPRARGPAS